MSLSFDNTEIAFRYRSNDELKKAHLLFSSLRSSFLTKVGIGLTKFAIKCHLPVTGLIKSFIFRQFCGGENLEEAAQTAAVLKGYNVAVALDYGVEGKTSEAEFDSAVPEFVKAIKYAGSQPNIPFIPIKVTGFADFALLEKKASGQVFSEAEKAAWLRIQVRIDQICAAAANAHIMILIDAEESWIQEPVDELADSMMRQYNVQHPVVFNTFQLYRHDRLVFLKKSLEAAQKSGYVLGAKLVRGAYMEKERDRAKSLGYPSPIQPDKRATDEDYDEAVAFCLEHLDQISVFIGTHNEASCLKAVDLMRDKQIPNNHPHVWLAQLYGMSDNITFNLAAENYHVAKYLPYGPVKDVIPYLMRRAEENSSVAGQTGREFSLIEKEMKRRKLS